MERKLPIIVIEGTEFIVDVTNEQLRERDRPENTLDIKKMSSKGFTKGYTFDYNVKTRNFPNERTDPRNDIKEIEIEDFCRIDPFGMALKYDISVEKVKISNDLELAIKTE